MPFAVNQSCIAQVREVKGKCGRGHFQSLGDFARRHAPWRGSNQQSKNGEPCFLGEACKDLGGVSYFHVFKTIKIVGAESRKARGGGTSGKLRIVPGFARVLPMMLHARSLNSAVSGTLPGWFCGCPTPP